MFKFAAVLLSSVIYLLSPSSAKDPSIVERASKIGVEEICFSDIFRTDSCGAVTDFYRLNGISNSGFVRFSRAARRKGIRLRARFAPDLTSTDHPWFRQSMEADSELVFSNFYFWRDSIASTDSASWVRADAPRGRFYRNDGHPGQAVLNLEDRSDTSVVMREFANIRSFWKGKGLMLSGEPAPACQWPHAPADSGSVQYKKIKMVHAMTMPVAVIEEGDEVGIEDYAASIVKFRLKHPAFREGGSMKDLSGTGTIAYLRSEGKDSFLIVINPGTTKIHYPLEGIAKASVRPVPVLSEGRAHFSATRRGDALDLDFSLGAMSLMILKL